MKRSILYNLCLTSVFSLLIFSCNSSSTWTPEEQKAYHKKLTGFEFVLLKNIYTYETLRSFHGDGYSIWIDSIDQKTADYFKNPNSDFFVNYPLS